MKPREAKVTPFQEMDKALQKIVLPYKLDLTNSDFFEDTILQLAGVEEKSPGCVIWPRQSARTSLFLF